MYHPPGWDIKYTKYPYTVTTQANANLRLGPLVPPMARVLLGRTRNYEKKIISYRSISILGSKGISVVRAG